MIRIVLSSIALAALPGCATFSKTFENRVACAASGGEAYSVSKWGPVGITATLAKADAAVICKETTK